MDGLIMYKFIRQRLNTLFPRYAQLRCVIDRYRYI